MFSLLVSQKKKSYSFQASKSNLIRYYCCKLLSPGWISISWFRIAGQEWKQKQNARVSFIDAKKKNSLLQLCSSSQFGPISFAMFPKIATMCGYWIARVCCSATECSFCAEGHINRCDALSDWSLKVGADDLMHAHYHRSPDMTCHWWRWRCEDGGEGESLIDRIDWCWKF